MHLTHQAELTRYRLHVSMGSRMSGSRRKQMGLMLAPTTGVTVRMYRQGHGDCFLLAFPGDHEKAIYVLIDCGLKAGSQIKGIAITEVISDIKKATGGFIDLVVVTHEHIDHVNGFTALSDGTGSAYAFDEQEINIGELWLAWTEDPKDTFASSLRRRYNDTLVALTRGLKALDEGKSMKASDPTWQRLQDLI